MKTVIAFFLGIFTIFNHATSTPPIAQNISTSTAPKITIHAIQNSSPKVTEVSTTQTDTASSGVTSDQIKANYENYLNEQTQTSQSPAVSQITNVTTQPVQTTSSTQVQEQAQQTTQAQINNLEQQITNIKNTYYQQVGTLQQQESAIAAQGADLNYKENELSGLQNQIEQLTSTANNQIEQIDLQIQQLQQSVPTIIDNSACQTATQNLEEFQNSYANGQADISMGGTEEQASQLEEIFDNQYNTELPAYQTAAQVSCQVPMSLSNDCQIALQKFATFQAQYPLNHENAGRAQVSNNMIASQFPAYQTDIQYSCQ